MHAKCADVVEIWETDVFPIDFNVTALKQE